MELFLWQLAYFWTLWKRKRGKGVDIVTCIIVSALTAAITTKILATHYFEIVDGYVKDLIELAKKTMEEIVSGQDKL